MAWLSVGLGLGVVTVVAVDLWLTVLHPTVRGPVSSWVERAVWLVARTAAKMAGRRTWLTFAGPTALLANVMAWLAGLWLGFALVYLPYGESRSMPIPTAKLRRRGAMPSFPAEPWAR